MKYVDKCDEVAGSHWFWRDGRSNHGHDPKGQAVLCWRTEPCAESRYLEHGVFNIARLLIMWQIGPTPSRSVFESICGLSQCVNPSHWRRLFVPATWRLEVHPEGWRVVRRSNGSAAPPKPQLLQAAHAGAVHLLQVTPEPRALFTVRPRMVCGLEVLAEDVLVTSSAVTCEACR
jgi:hypothetical protein